MPTIYAWMFDPNSFRLFGKKKKSDRGYFHRVECDHVETCDIAKMGNCMFRQAKVCKVGRKTTETSPTQRAKSYHGWMREKKEAADEIKKSSPITVEEGVKIERICKVGPFYYLPYSHLPDTVSEWIPLEDMNEAVLAKITSHIPRDWFQNEITRYRKEIMPKFVGDLQLHFPELYDLLSDAVKERFTPKSYVGRKARLRTVAEGRVEIKNKIWQWKDGKLIRALESFDMPCAGDGVIKVTPHTDACVVITRDNQVLPETEFVD